MAQLRMFLPSLRRSGGALTSDYLVHPTALAHLRRRFNNICSSLLRNDSLTDMSERSSVYFELFEWLEVGRLNSCCGSRLTSARLSRIMRRFLA
jgi:hypothetical protein